MNQRITFCGQAVRVACDERCHKAWGQENRPSEIGEDGNLCWLADHELGLAPVDPGTAEGGDRKPVDRKGIPNKWCVRQCERCTMTRLGSEG